MRLAVVITNIRTGFDSTLAIPAGSSLIARADAEGRVMLLMDDKPLMASNRGFHISVVPETKAPERTSLRLEP